MAVDSKQLISIIIPTIAVVVAVAITAFFAMRKMRHSSQKNILPRTENLQSTFVQHHLTDLRRWEKPARPARPTTDQASQPTRFDPGHLPLLAQPTTSHQPERSTRLTWQQFKERQRQRDIEAQNRTPLEQWHLKPKGAAYWRQVGEEMEARKSWWQKLCDKYRFN
jgi:hypothetical protein